MRTTGRLLVIATLCLGFVTGARGAAGDLDPTFGGDPVLGPGAFGPGVFVSDRAESAAAYYGRGLALQSDGKVVLTFGAMWIHRLATDGLPDQQFGVGGGIQLMGVADVAIAPGDQLLAVGSQFSQDYRYYGYVARISAAGDPSTIEVDSDPSRFNRVTVAGGGGVVVGGVSTRRRSRFLVQRYTADGSLDATFGSRGTGRFSRLGTADGAAAILPTADGRTVVVGTGWDRRTTPPGDADLALSEYTVLGRVDRDFGSRGTVATHIGMADFAFDAALQPDGRVVVAGTTGTWPLPNLFLVLRYLPNGSLDPSFGEGGVVTTDFGGEDAKAYAVAIQADGKIVAAGEADESIAVARYLPDGTLDAGFGNGGLVRTAVPPAASAEALELVIQPDGKIIAGGLACRLWTPGAAPSCYYAVAVRYLPE